MDRLVLAVPPSSAWGYIVLVALWCSLLGLTLQQGSLDGGIRLGLGNCFSHGLWFGALHIYGGCLGDGWASHSPAAHREEPCGLNVLKQEEELVWDLSSSIHPSYVTPMNIGRAWYHPALLA